MQLKFFHDVKCIIFIIEVLLLSPFINNFFGIILTYLTNHDILYHKSHWTCRLIANLLQKWLVITVRPTTSVRKNPRKKLPPRNTPDSFCRRLTPTKSIAALRGRYFSFMVTCRGGGPSILLAQDRSVAQKPHWGFCCCANAAFCFPKKQKIRTLLLLRKGSDFHYLVRVVIQHFLKTIVVQFVFEVIG